MGLTIRSALIIISGKAGFPSTTVYPFCLNVTMTPITTTNLMSQQLNNACIFLGHNQKNFAVNLHIFKCYCFIQVFRFFVPTHFKRIIQQFLSVNIAISYCMNLNFIIFVCMYYVKHNFKVALST